MPYWFQKKTSKKGVSFILVLSIMYLLLISGVPAEPAYAADIPTIKHGVLVVPVCYNNNTTEAGIVLRGTQNKPIVELSTDMRYYDLNDVFCGTARYHKRVIPYNKDEFGEDGMGKVLPEISLNSFIRNASYGQDTVEPIYLTADEMGGAQKMFIPFSAGEWNEELPELWAEDYGNKEGAPVPGWKHHLQAVLDQASSIGALSSDTVAAYMKNAAKFMTKDRLEVKGEYADFGINSVVFLVNVSHAQDPQTLRMINRTVWSAGESGMALSLKTAPGAKIRHRWELSIDNYAVVFAGPSLPYPLLHEVMHLMGVADLYYLSGATNEYPALQLDIQSGLDCSSGPYYLQRLNMHNSPLNGRLKERVTKKKVEFWTQGLNPPAVTTPIGVRYDLGRVILNDLNFIGEGGSVVCRIDVELDGIPFEYYLEYRRPETDVYALKPRKIEGVDASAVVQKDGYLVLYTTGDSRTKYYEDARDGRYKPVYTMAVYPVSKYLAFGGGPKFPSATSRYLVRSEQVRKGILYDIPSFFSQDSKPYYKLDFTISNVTVEPTKAKPLGRNLAANVELCFDLSVDVRSVKGPFPMGQFLRLTMDRRAVGFIEGMNGIRDY